VRNGVSGDCSSAVATTWSGHAAS